MTNEQAEKLCRYLGYPDVLRVAPAAIELDLAPPCDGVDCIAFNPSNPSVIELEKDEKVFAVFPLNANVKSRIHLEVMRRARDKARDNLAAREQRERELKVDKMVEDAMNWGYDGVPQEMDLLTE